MSEGAGEGSGRATGVEPGALSALLQEVAAAPEVRETEPATLPPGTLVGRFEIVRELGRGGFGVVYEARDRDLGRSVAVKVVRPGRVRDEEGKVAREAEAIARLGHPNLITLFEVGRSEHGPFLVFELLRGKTLDLRIEEGPLPVQEAVHVATEVARGLAHAHAEGVIHRDLKPPNVFVTNKGQVKILDFGMAHAFGRRRISGGTPAYMAPEQWEDEPEDERTDVFALGVMLYRMLTGEYPFPEGEGRWAAEGVAARKVDVPGAPGLADLVEKMLDRKPKERPRDGASVLEALEPIEARLRTRPADGKPPEHARRRKATFGDLLAELKRRHVFRVMVGYGVFAFALLQVVEPIIHGAELPGWTLKAVLAALALGFPLAVVLAWIYDLTAQGVKRTPSAAVSGGRSFGRSRMLAPLAVSAALLLLAAVGAAGWHAWNGTKITPATHGTDARPMVAVADFSNETGEKELDSVSGLLITSLEQSRGLRVLTRSRMFDVARQLGKGDVPRIDESLAREVGRRVGARAVLLAAIRRTGDGYVVDLHAVDPSRDEYLFTVRERAAGKAAVFDLVDRVATVSRERLGPPGRAPDAAGTGVAALTTGDMRAWDLFSQARQAIDHLRFAEADTLLQEAIAIDPEFALAHYQRAMLFQWRTPDAPASLSDRVKAGEALSRAAQQRAERLPEKERLLLRSFEEYRAGSSLEAMRIRRQVADAYPLDKEAQFLAGHVLVGTFEKTAAIPYLQRALQLDPSYDMAKLFLARALAGSGQAARHVDWLRREAEEVTVPRHARSLAAALLVAGDESRALALLRRTQGSGGDAPLPVFAIRHLVSAGRVEEAATELTKAMTLARAGGQGEPREDAGIGRVGHFHLLVALGRVGEARRLLDGASPSLRPALGAVTIAAFDRDPGGLRAAATKVEVDACHPYFDGVVGQYAAPILAHAGDVEAAGRIAAATRAGPLRSGYAPTSSTLLEALEAWGRGDRAKAREGFATLAAHGDADVRYLGQLMLGDLAFAGGDCLEAIAALEGARAIRWTFAVEDPWSWSIPGVLRTLTTCYERTGDLARARERNDELLRRLAEADPDLPALAEARRRRASLGPAGPAEAATTPSIAILPFADMSPKHDQEYFADGVAEEIRNALAHIDGLKVIGRTSSSSFKGKPDDLQAIGRKLGVATVLEGSLRSDGNRIRINVQLIRAADGTHLWSESFDRKPSGIFEIQDEIARSVVGALKVKLLPGRDAGRISTRAANVEAYKLHLLARSIVAPETPEARRRASEVWERAAQIDPGYALPHVFLAINAYNQARAAPDTAEADRLEKRAREEMDRALQIDPEEGTAYAMRAWMRAEAWDWSGARQDLDKAESLNADRAVVDNSRAMLLATAGRLDEAVAAQRRTLEVEPLAAVFHGNLAQYLLYAGRYGEAREAVRRTLEISPKFDRALRQQATLDLLQGRPEAALRGFERGDGHAPTRLRDLAIANHALGRARESAAALAELERDHGDQRFLIAEARAYRGDRDGALRLLEAAVESRDPYLGRIKISWALRPLRDDARYVALLRKMKLPVEPPL